MIDLSPLRLSVQAPGHCVQPRKLSLWSFNFDSLFGRGLTSGTVMRAHTEHRWLFPTVGRLFFVLILLSACASQAHALFPHHENAHKELEGLELDWRQAQPPHNLPEVAPLLAADYPPPSAHGTLEPKPHPLTRPPTASLHI